MEPDRHPVQDQISRPQCYAFWTEDLAAAVTKMANSFKERDVSGREFWLRGSASEQFEDELNRLGWKVRQQIQLTEEIKKQFTNAADS